MTTLRERHLLNSLKIRAGPFVGDNRRRRILIKSRKSILRDPGLEGDFCWYYDNEADISGLDEIDIKPESNVKLGDIIMAKKGLDLRKIFYYHFGEIPIEKPIKTREDEIREEWVELYLLRSRKDYS